MLIVPATTPTESAPRPPGPKLCGVCPIRHPPAKPSATDSIGAVTARPTLRSTRCRCPDATSSTAQFQSCAPRSMITRATGSDPFFCAVVGHQRVDGVGGDAGSATIVAWSLRCTLALKTLLDPELSPLVAQETSVRSTLRILRLLRRLLWARGILFKKAGSP